MHHPRILTIPYPTVDLYAYIHIYTVCTPLSNEYAHPYSSMYLGLRRTWEEWSSRARETIFLTLGLSLSFRLSIYLPIHPFWLFCLARPSPLRLADMEDYAADIYLYTWLIVYSFLVLTSLGYTGFLVRYSRTPVCVCVCVSVADHLNVATIISLLHNLVS